VLTRCIAQGLRTGTLIALEGPWKALFSDASLRPIFGKDVATTTASSLSRPLPPVGGILSAPESHAYENWINALAQASADCTVIARDRAAQDEASSSRGAPLTSPFCKSEGSRPTRGAGTKSKSAPAVPAKRKRADKENPTVAPRNGSRSGLRSSPRLALLSSAHRRTPSNESSSSERSEPASPSRAPRRRIE
jgi:hypothetical protein